MEPGGVKTQIDGDVLRELESVLESPDFHGSHRAQTLLRYLVENAFSHRSDRLKERTIGIELFHREADYDTGQDGIVRVAASDVRKRLTNHYSHKDSTCSGSGIRIVLPSGSYVPLFETPEHVPTAASSVGEQPSFVAAEVTPPPRSRSISLTVIAVLAVACAILGLQNWRLRSNAAAKANLDILPWSRIAGKATATIAVGDLNFVLYQQLTQRIVPLDDYVRHKWLDKLAAELPYAPTTSRVPLTVTSHGTVAGNLSGMLRQAGSLVAIRSARSLQLSDFRTERPIILVGSALSNPWVALFEKKLNFRIVSDLPRDMQSCVNAEPRAGELSAYVPTAATTPAPGVAYALVSLVPNLTRKGFVLIVEGTNIESTEAAGDLLNDLPRLSEALRRRGIDPHGNVERLQLLMRVQCVDGSYSSVEIITHRIEN